MSKATAKHHILIISLFIILVAASIFLLIFVGGLDKKILDSIRAVIKIIEVGP